MNDWYDREIDAINEPYRPIPSGAISENEVRCKIETDMSFPVATFLSSFNFLICCSNSAGDSSNMVAATRRSYLGWYIGHMGGYCTQ